MGPRARPFAIRVSCSAGPVGVSRTAETSVRLGRLAFTEREKERKREKGRVESNRSVAFGFSLFFTRPNRRNLPRKRKSRRRKGQTTIARCDQSARSGKPIFHGTQDRSPPIPERIGAFLVRIASGCRRVPDVRTRNEIVTVVVVVVAASDKGKRQRLNDGCSSR